MATQVNDFYPTDGSASPITLQVQTGYGQAYETAVRLNGAAVAGAPPPDATGAYPDDFSFSIGSNAELADGLLELTTYAFINTNPPQSSVIITLTGGKAPKSFSMTDPGAGSAPGASVSYHASIALT